MLIEACEKLKSGYPKASDEVQEYLTENKGVLPKVFLQLPPTSVQLSEAEEREVQALEPEVRTFIYELAEFLGSFPFDRQLRLLWCNSHGYCTHGPAVLDAMNALLTGEVGEILRGSHDEEHQRRVRETLLSVKQAFTDWQWEEIEALLRLGALYHDIGKYIIKERHPTIGWYIAEYIDPYAKEDLRALLQHNDEYLQLLMTIIRDHDQFGVLSTGEASYPILLRAAGSASDRLRPEHILSALMLCNLADMAGTFDVDGSTVDKVIDDWAWMRAAVEHCRDDKLSLDDYIIREASSVEMVVARIRRLLEEASRPFDARREELASLHDLHGKLVMVFGNTANVHRFAADFAHICKLDYGKRFFEAVIEYCEGEKHQPRTRHFRFVLTIE